LNRHCAVEFNHHNRIMIRKRHDEFILVERKALITAAVTRSV